MFGRLFSRAAIQIRCLPDGSLEVKATGVLEPYLGRIQSFVQEAKMPAGNIYLTRGWRWKFPAHFSAAQEQQFRNFLGAEVPVLPPGPQGSKRA